MDPCPVLVGRQQELSALRAILDAGGGVAVVSGEAGIGKSRLVREFAKEAEERGRIVLWARPEEVAQPGPYALIVDLLESIAERGNASVKADARALAAGLARSTDADAQAPPPAVRTVAAEMRGLASRLDAHPVVVLEDLHWADEASHSLVLQLARAARDDGHLLVATLRSEAATVGSLGRLIESLARDRVAQEITLDPLGHDEIAVMVELIQGQAPSAEQLLEIERLGEGVPFFIEELAGSSDGVGPQSVPRNIEQTVATRMRALGDEAAVILRAASLMVGQLDVPVLAYASDIPEGRVANRLVDGVTAGLLADKEGRLLFRHALVRKAVSRSLVSVEVARWHGRLAEALEKIHGTEVEAFSSALAHHYREAGDRQAAVRYAVMAGERALALAATGDARAAFEMARDLGDGLAIEAIRGLAEVEFREGNERVAADLFRRAADELKRRGASVEAAQTLGRLAWAIQGQVGPTQVLEVMDEGLGFVSHQSDGVERARLLVQKGGFLCFLYTDGSRAMPILQEALAVAQRSGDQSVVAEALDGLAQASVLQGLVSAALDLGSQAIEAAKKSTSAESIGRTHNNHAVRLGAAGEPVPALDVLAEGRKQVRSTYGRAAVGAMDVSKAWLMWLMGLPAEAAHLAARGRSAWQRWRGYRWLIEVWAAIERGDLDLARASASESWRELGGDEFFDTNLPEPKGLGFEAMQVVVVRAMVERASGNPSTAAILTEALVPVAREKMEPHDFAQLLSEHALALIDVGAHAASAEASRSLTALSEGFAYPYIEGLAFLIQGVVASTRSDSGQAIAALERSASAFAGCSNSSDQARAKRLLAASLPRDGSDTTKANAIRHLREAREIAVGCGAVVEANRAEAMLREMGIRPRAGRPRRDPSSSSRLSPRESEVVALVAAGETNADIAARLFLSERTVQDHITHALRKLALSGRAALASWAVKQGMI